jgi:phosphinothricin acetyltransferase
MSQSDNVIIRAAASTDLPQILEIVNHAILNTTSNYLYEAQTLADQARWFENKKSKDFPIFVADINGTAIGFGTYGTFREKIGYQFTVEHSVYVAPDHVEKGIGKQLMRALIDSAKNEGYHTMIGGIDAANAGSIEFHKKFGFEETGVIKEVGFKFGKWLDLQFMQLILK